MILCEKYIDVFLLADIYFDGDNRIIILASENLLKYFEDATEVLVDGTFKCCPRQFAQAYSLYVDIGSILEVTNIVSCIYAFLSNKKQNTYENKFLFKENMLLWSTKKLRIDFDAPVINAAKKCLPSVELKGCDFHYNQSELIKVQNLDLFSEYKDNEEIKSFIRKCSALAHIPPDSLDNGWLSIMENVPSTVATGKFIDYMVEQYLEICWSNVELLWRTTNALEG
ncbi:hypothetical protein AVEN_190361-1 [Araneus ventricosus]|uniref:MULE transposase domain-containing protein n=1 Tax=Araneus ventricosus TaxID=182803 RepID=A0A4Y2GPX8_ARAVE|nr:hypothetical protein AVEN_190361-1 [Araneus ventricosus]